MRVSSFNGGPLPALAGEGTARRAHGESPPDPLTERAVEQLGRYWDL